MSVCHSALVCFSVAMTKSNLGKERVNFNWHFQVIGGLPQGRNSNRNQSRNHGGKRLSGSLCQAPSQSTSFTAQAHCLGMALLLVSWTGPHQSPTRHSSDIAQACLIYAVPQCRLSSPRCPLIKLIIKMNQDSI